MSFMYKDRFKYLEIPPMPEETKQQEQTELPLPTHMDKEDLLEYHAYRASKEDAVSRANEVNRAMNEFLIRLGQKYSLTNGDSFDYRTGVITRQPRS